ncbi:hypothetical protein B0E33_18805 [Roseibium algicola]|uniref:Uncharacterized protein n=1 Tax=Roseibium algicola TaxID=2857014 RepID=A0ABN4WW87_9HYPH|nr:hypothetical protein B0E33_18805 [Roseibium aggregatum]
MENAASSACREIGAFYERLGVGAVFRNHQPDCQRACENAQSMLLVLKDCLFKSGLHSSISGDSE